MQSKLESHLIAIFFRYIDLVLCKLCTLLQELMTNLKHYITLNRMDKLNNSIKIKFMNYFAIT